MCLHEDPPTHNIQILDHILALRDYEKGESFLQTDSIQQTIGLKVKLSKTDDQETVQSNHSCGKKR